MSAYNPYQVPVTSNVAVSDSASTRQKGRLQPIACWFRCWIGISASGMVFGVIGGPFGVIIGGLLASAVSLCMTVLLFLPSVLLAGDRLSRTHVLCLGAFCGAASGTLSMCFLTSGFTMFALVPGAIGAMGGAIGNISQTARNARSSVDTTDEIPEW